MTAQQGCFDSSCLSSGPSDIDPGNITTDMSSSGEERISEATDSGSEYIFSDRSSEGSDGESEGDSALLSWAGTQKQARLSDLAAFPSTPARPPSPQVIRRPGRPRKLRRGQTSIRSSTPTLGTSEPRPSIESTTTPSITSAWDGDPSVLVQDPWQFNGRPGYNITVAKITPLEIFQQFLDEEFFEDLAMETNRYASQMLSHAASSGTTQSPHSYTTKWKPVTKKEMKSFIGLSFSMGVVKMPQVRNYWQKTQLYKSDFWSNVMSRNRFLSILSFLHCNDNSQYIPKGRDGYDPLFKVAPVIRHLQQKFQTIYSPRKELSLDEGTCPFKGRVQFRSYNPRKPKKWGIKIFELCEAESGYCLKFQIATGALSQEASARKRHDLVLHMMEGYKDRGHELYMDRYYTSVALFDALYEQKVIAVGTCRIDTKGLPSEVKRQLKTRGEVRSFRKANLLVLKWKDKKEVLMLSTKHTDDMTTASVRSPGGRKEKLKPVVVSEYNKYMCGVDKSDQRLSYYSIERKSVKWWRKLFFHLLNITTINAYIVYSKVAESDGQQALTFLKFIESIVMKLTGTAPTPGLPTQAARPSRGDTTEQHFPHHTPPTAKRQHAQRDCYVCYRKLKQEAEIQRAPGDPMPKIRSTKTQFYCPTCNVGLHPAPCFKIYHTEDEYCN